MAFYGLQGNESKYCSNCEENDMLVLGFLVMTAGFTTMVVMRSSEPPCPKAVAAVAVAVLAAIAGTGIFLQEQV